MKCFRKVCVAAGALLVSATVSAQATAPVTLECGGIGIEESRMMLAAQKDHALTIVFATRSGSYVSGVATKVADPLADVAANHPVCGPVGQVDVSQASRYRVTATLDGVMREEWVDLKPGGGARIVLRWLD